MTRMALYRAPRMETTMYDRSLANYVRTRLLPSKASEEAADSATDSKTQADVASVAPKKRPCGNVFASVSGAVTQLASDATSRLAARSKSHAVGGGMAALDDHVLQDLGLNRGQLPAALAGMGRTPWSRDWAGAGPQNATDATDNPAANYNSRTKTAA